MSSMTRMEDTGAAVVGIVGEDAHDERGKDHGEQEQRQDGRRAHPHDAVANGHELLRFAVAHQIADDGRSGRSESRSGHVEECQYVPYDVGYGERPFAEVLDGKEEEEPRSRRDEILYGRPARNTEYLSLYQRQEALKRNMP